MDRVGRGQFKILRCAMPAMHVVEASTRHRFARHTHDEYGIGVFYQGAQKSCSGRGMVEACAGDVVTVNPGEVHDGVPIGDTERRWRTLYFAPELIAGAVADISEGAIGSYEFVDPVIRNAALARRLHRLLVDVTAEVSAGTEAQAHLLHEESLLLLLGEIMQAGGRMPDRIPVAIVQAKRCIDDDPAAPITLADLSRASGLSQFQIVRGFAKATGLTPHAYLMQRRIHTARRLIARGTPLAEAAVESGFVDQSHMTRIFVRQYGLSPRVYADGIAG